MEGVYGDFEEYPFAEVLLLLAQRVGHLAIEAPLAPGRTALLLHRGLLLAMSDDERGTLTPDALHTRLRQLFEAARGRFKFSAVDVTGPLRLDLAPLVARATHAPAAAFQLDLSQRFVWVNAPRVPDGPLDMFLTRARSLLSRGASATDLAAAFHLSPQDVQRQLAEARLAGAVQPTDPLLPNPALLARQEVHPPYHE